MRFRLLTYNIHKAIGVDRRFEPDRIVEVLRHHDADIVLLQEVERSTLRSEFLDLAAYLSRRLEYPHRAVGINVHIRRGRYGNATLSRFPIGRSRNIDLTGDSRIRRGAQHTCVHLSAGGRALDLEVFNIHLGLTKRVRALQLRQLFECRDFARLTPATACIVAGDMNDWRGALRCEVFPAHGFHCATDRRPGRRAALRTFPSFAPTIGLDRIYFRGPLRLLSAHVSRMAIARRASDHLPVTAEFETVQ